MSKVRIDLGELIRKLLIESPTVETPDSVKELLVRSIKQKDRTATTTETVHK